MRQLGLQRRLEPLRDRSQSAMSRNQAELSAESLWENDLDLRCRLLSQVDVGSSVPPRFGEFVPIHAKAVSRIALRIHIDDAGSVSRVGEPRCQADSRRRLAAPTLLIR